jgi:hypothetical protein
LDGGERDKGFRGDVNGFSVMDYWRWGVFEDVGLVVIAVRLETVV